MSAKIETYAELQKMIRNALREQHPEWIDAHGESATCDSYETRFAELLVLFGQGSKRSALPACEHQSTATHWSPWKGAEQSWNCER
jgi:hypothetical protein